MVFKELLELAFSEENKLQEPDCVKLVKATHSLTHSHTEAGGGVFLFLFRMREPKLHCKIFQFNMI